jgi:phosphatidylinositol-3-phosphatase
VAPPKVMVLLLENHGYDGVINSAQAPRINALATRYGLATHSYAQTHPSLPNYLDLVAGSSLGISGDCTDCSVEGTSVVDQLVQKGYDWRAYMEGMPSACYTGDSYAGLYAKKYDPFMYFAHIRNDPSACAKVQPYTGFAAALAADTLPAYTWVTPDMCHNGHDCPLPQSDAWVGDFVQGVVASPWFADGGVLFVTYDEGTTDNACCQGAAGGHIATLVISKSTSPGARLDTDVDHAGLLRTIEELYGLPLLGAASCACSGDLRPLTGR